MATFGQAVRGIADCRVAKLTGDVPAATATDIVGIKGLEVSTSSDSDEQRGDDQVLFTVTEGKKLDITITAALANLDVLGILANSTLIKSGTTPNQVVTFKEPSTSAGAYVEITGQAASRDTAGSSLTVKILKASLTDGPNYAFSEGSWLEPELSFTGIARAGFLYELTANETAPTVTRSDDEPAPETAPASRRSAS